MFCVVDLLKGLSMVLKLHTITKLGQICDLKSSNVYLRKLYELYL